MSFGLEYEGFTLAHSKGQLGHCKGVLPYILALYIIDIVWYNIMVMISFLLRIVVENKELQMVDLGLQ